MDIDVIRVTAKSRHVGATWVIEEVLEVTMQGPSTGRVHPSAKRATDRRKATIWKRLIG